MGKQTFDRTKKTLIILLVVLYIISITSASVAASWFSEEGSKIASGTHEAEKK
jgi:flagellar basal body-associated protein FliL